MVFLDPHVVNQQSDSKAVVLFVGLLQIKADSSKMNGLVTNQRELVVFALSQFSQGVNLVVVARNQRPESRPGHAVAVDQVGHVLLGLVQVSLGIGAVGI